MLFKTMAKIVPFSKLIKHKMSELSELSVIVDNKNVPLGFVFGRDSFIAFLEHMDDEFEKRTVDKKKAYDNPAGKLIDLIEEKLPVNKKFILELRDSVADAKKEGWVPLDEVLRSLHV